MFCGGEFEGMIVGCRGGLDEDGAVQARAGAERGRVAMVRRQSQVGPVEAWGRWASWKEGAEGMETGPGVDGGETADEGGHFGCR